MSVAYGQGKKYIRHNEDARIITYGDSSIYARGIVADGKKLFVGNSDGSIYYINLETGESQMLFNLPNMDEIRDLAITDNCLIGMHSGTDGKLVELDFKGGAHITYLKGWQGVFFDGLDLEGEIGFIMGDPINGIFSLFHSSDEGSSWTPCAGAIPAIKGEAGFAASGTNVQVLNDSTYIFVSGGESSRFFKSTDNGTSWMDVKLPYFPGESIGAYSMCFSSDTDGVIVGGDYKDPTLGMNTCFYTNDGGASWYNAMESVRGYRSCVYFTEGVYYACGRTGIDFSLDGGKTWTPFANGTYFSMTSTEDYLIATTRYGQVKLFDLIKGKDE
ncbi:MAG: hypothetical protein QNK23_11095 [Crocinitomicaceae bacterium]|nr:hypothetical protein [Crocinitomicaceae bacterium]